MSISTLAGYSDASDEVRRDTCDINPDVGYSDVQSKALHENAEAPPPSVAEASREKVAAP